MASAIVDFLKTRVEILAGLSEADLLRLAASIEFRTVKNGQTVLFKGEAVEGLHVVREGAVHVFLKPPKEKEWKKVAELGPGGFFGETSIIEETVAGALVKGGADNTQLLIIPQGAFLELIKAHPEFKQKISAVIESRRPPQAPGKAPHSPAPQA